MSVGLFLQRAAVWLGREEEEHRAYLSLVGLTNLAMEIQTSLHIFAGFLVMFMKKKSTTGSRVNSAPSCSFCLQCAPAGTPTLSLSYQNSYRKGCSHALALKEQPSEKVEALHVLVHLLHVLDSRGEQADTWCQLGAGQDVLQQRERLCLHARSVCAEESGFEEDSRAIFSRQTTAGLHFQKLKQPCRLSSRFHFSPGNNSYKHYNQAENIHLSSSSPWWKSIVLLDCLGNAVGFWKTTFLY